MQSILLQFFLLVAVFLSTSTVLAATDAPKDEPVIHYMSTGVDPEVFVREKIANNEVRDGSLVMCCKM